MLTVSYRRFGGDWCLQPSVTGETLKIDVGNLQLTLRRIPGEFVISTALKTSDRPRPLLNCTAFGFRDIDNRRIKQPCGFAGKIWVSVSLQPAIFIFPLSLPVYGTTVLYSQVVTICTTSLTFTILRSAHTAVFMCFVWISEQTAIISLYSINWLVYIIQTECVYCAVRTETNIFRLNLFFGGGGAVSNLK